MYKTQYINVAVINNDQTSCVIISVCKIQIHIGILNHTKKIIIILYGCALAHQVVTQNIMCIPRGIDSDKLNVT